MPKPLLNGIYSDYLIKRGFSITLARKLPIVLGMLPVICLLRCAYQAYELDTCPQFVCCAALIRPTNSTCARNLSAALRLSGLRTRYVPAIRLMRCTYLAYELDTCPLFV